MKRKYYLRGLGFGVLVTSLVFIFTGKSSDISEAEIIRRAEELGYVKAEVNQEKNVTPSINLEELLNKEGTETPEPTETPIPESTEVPTPTETPELTEAPTPTETPELTEAPTPTEMPELTEVPTPTQAPEVSATPAPTMPLTEVTPTPTEALEPTVTVTPTVVPVGTPTPLPSGQVTEVITVKIKVAAGVHAKDVSRQLMEAGIIEDAEAFSRYLMKDDWDNYVVDGTYTVSSDMSFEELAKIITKREE